MLAVVAEKTGYPVEMLSEGMDLEADLGVDSIKRVEILSSIRERVPGLPEVDAGELSSLRTLGEIAAKLGANQGSGRTILQAQPEAIGPPAAGLGRFVVEVVAAPASGLGVVGLGRGDAQVVGGPADVADAVVARLAAAGVRARAVPAVRDTPYVVVHLGGLGPFASADAASSASRAVFLDLRAVGARFAASGGVFATVQASGGDFGLGGRAGRDAWACGLTGLVKTAALEWPAASLKAIDVGAAGLDAATVASRIVDELLAGGAEREVGFAVNGDRQTLRARVASLSKDVAKLGASDVVLASGGARGVTAASLVALAQATRASFVLLGRTPLADEPAWAAGLEEEAALKRAYLQAAMAAGEKPAPASVGKAVDGVRAGREVRETLAAIGRAGGRARYAAVDVQDADALAALVRDVAASWGPVTVVVHGAGVLADKKIADKTDAQFDRVFDTKVGGLKALLAAVEGQPVSTLALFSSVAARGGNLGQCDYAAANEVLNRVGAALAHERGWRVVSFGWGPWEGGMVTPALKAHFQAAGVALIPLDGGARLFADDLMWAGPGATELVIGGSADASALLGESGPPRVRAGVRVNASTTPALDGHRVRGEAVVPVVFALEWMVRAAQTARPDLHLAEVRDLSVLRGIRVPSYDAEGVELVVEATQRDAEAGATLITTIAGIDGRKHYEATIRMTASPSAGEGAPRSPAVGDHVGGPLYDGDVLFHGPSFQVVDAVEGLGPEGLVARLGGLDTVGWTGAWATDPAALDGLLQLGLVWFDASLGGASLPTAIGRVRVHRPGALVGPLRAVLRRKSTSRDQARLDATLVDAGGAVVAAFEDLQLTRLPGAAARVPTPEA
jgi:hypothetical protein